MNDERKKLNELFDRCDRNDAATDAWLAQRAQQQKKRAIDPSRLVYKMVYTEPQPQVMDVEGSARWNAWFSAAFDVHITKYFEEYSDIVGDEMGKAIKARVQELRDEIAALRAEVEILRAHTVKVDTPHADGTPTARRDVH